MQTYLIYSRQTPGEQQMKAMGEELSSRQARFELIDADGVRGIQLTDTYDILARPAILIVRDDGAPVSIWADPEHLPTIEEVSYWSRM